MNIYVKIVLADVLITAFISSFSQNGAIFNYVSNKTECFIFLKTTILLCPTLHFLNIGYTQNFISLSNINEKLPYFQLS